MYRLAPVAGALLGMLALPAAAVAHHPGEPQPAATAAAPERCPGDDISPTRAITGEFPAQHQGSYVLVPFDVPAGTTAVRVKYCHDQPESPAGVRHTLDIGLYDARRPGRLWGEREFRGWGGSSHPDVTVSREGFSTEDEYRERPRGHVPGKTTRGFKPGPIPAGEWAVELGLAAIVPQTQGDADGRVAWRIEIELSRDPAFADEPYAPTPYDERPARAEPGWYAGDMHVHAEHSSLGDATMTETFDYAFAPAAEGGAGLDFITLSDYVTDSAWGEIGRYQGRYPGKLVVRSSEVITYRGHLNNHASLRYVDYRTGPIHERRPNGELDLRRPARPPSELFDLVHASGGWTQVNHPTIFPSELPAFANLCRGCPWDYTDAETDWEKVDAYEVSTGPAALRGSGGALGPNPFTLTAIEEWDRLREQRYPVTAVGSSDSHNAGRVTNPVTQSPIGEGTTVVYADELSEEAIRRGIVAGHAYVKLLGADSPDLRFEAEGSGGERAIMGDALPAGEARFEATVTGGAPAARELLVLRDGDLIQTVPVTGSSFTHRFTASQPGEYRIQVQRGNTVDALSNPIGLGVVRREKPPVGRRGAGGSGERQRMRLTVTPRRTRVGRRTRFVFRASAGGEPVRGATIRFAGRRTRTDARGRAVLVRRFRRSGTYRARATRAGMLTARVAVVVAAAAAGPRFTG